MDRDKDKILNISEYLNDGDKHSEEEIKALIDSLMDYHGSQFDDGYDDYELTEETASSAHDFMELALRAKSDKRALKYAKTALRLDPENIQAEVLIAEISSKTHSALIEKLQKICDKESERLRADGFFDEENIGDFWTIIETRPYMMLNYKCIDELINSGKMRLAAEKCEEMLRLSRNDNLGLRYKLIQIYAFLEDENSALGVLKRYNESKNPHMLLPLSILYFKLGDLKESTKYLRQLKNSNPFTRELFEIVQNGEMFDCIDNYEEEPEYAVNTLEELIDIISLNKPLLLMSQEYYVWAMLKLKKMK